MKQKATKRLFAVLLVMLMALSILPTLALNANESPFDTAKDGGRVGDLSKQDTLTPDPTEIVDIMVEVKDNEPLMEVFKLDDIRAKKSTVNTYENRMLTRQDSAKGKIEALVEEKVETIYNHTLLFNGFSFKGEYGWIEKINSSVSGVYAFAAPTYDAPEPLMATSTGIIEAPVAWNLGYTGVGKLVAVIDTGLRISHEAFSVMPDNPALTQTDVADIIANNPMKAGGSAAQLYYNQKVPFGYDYYYKTNTIHHRGMSDGDDHGTHVAGTAVGNNGSDFKGVAYDAQLVVMQVFQAGGGTSASYYLPALEDCVYLGVDAANMSLGAPCGSTEITELPESYNRVFELIKESGMSLSVSAGNSGTSASENGAKGNQLATAPDYGLVGSPSTYSVPLSVAAGNNAGMVDGAIVVDGQRYEFTDNSESPEDSIISVAGTYDYVVVPGFGFPSDYEGIDVEGKVALVSRGDSSFDEKLAAAADAGAVAMVLYNNEAGGIGMIITEYFIPGVSITQTNGRLLIEAAGEDGIGELTFLVFEGTAAPSDFSSRGTTAELAIKPEIMAPGASINSSIGLDEDDSYASWNGTSMASPHVAGAMAVLKEYLTAMFPDATPEELRELTDAILMNTAVPVVDGETGMPFSPREQGAGMMNLGGAVTTKAYVTVDSNVRPKLELGSDAERTGRYTLSFTVHNFGASELTFDLDYTIQSEKPYTVGAFGDTEFINGTPLDLGSHATDNAPQTVTVPAGGSVDVSFTITLNENGMAYLDEHYETGMFIEGFVMLEAQADGEGYAAPTLGLPYLGFYGDWNEPAMFDDGWYWQDNPVHNHPRPNTFGFKNGSEIQGLGLNPYVDMTEAQYQADRNAISPNGDGRLDSVNVGYTGILRNSVYGHYAINFEDGTQTILKSWDTDLFERFKGFFYDSRGKYMQLGDTHLPFPTWNASDLDEGESVEIEIRADLGYEGYTPEANARGKLIIPVTKDTTKPSAVNASVNGDGTLTLTLTDENYLAYYAVYGDGAMTDEIESADVFENTRGAQTQVTVTAPTGADYIYLFLGDYAANESAYKVNVSDGGMQAIDGPVIGGAEIIIFDEQFSSNPMWNVADLDGDGVQWGIFTDPADAELGYEGEAGFAGSWSINTSTGAPITPDNWLLTPAGAITVPDDGNEYFVRYYLACTERGPEYHSLMVGPDNATSTAQFTAIHSEELTEQGYKEFVVSLADYAGESIRLAWRHHNTTGGFLMRLDNVQIYCVTGGEQPTPTPPPVITDGVNLFGYSVVDMVPDAQGNYSEEFGWITFNSADPLNTMEFLSRDGIVMSAADYVDGVIYAYDEGGNLYAVDPDTFEETLIGNCGYEVYDLAYDHEAGVMYAQVYSAGAGGSQTLESKPLKAGVGGNMRPLSFDVEGRYLATVDLKTGEVTELFMFNRDENIFPIGLACIGNGEFISVDYMTDTLYRFDVDGNFEEIGALSVESGNYSQSMTFDPETGLVYWAAATYSGEGVLVIADPVSGENEVVDYIDDPNGTEVVGLFVKEAEVEPTPTPEQPTPTPEQPTPTPEQPTPTPEQPTPTPEQPTPTPEQPTPTPVQPTPEPEDPPKAGGVSLAIAGAAFAAIGCAGIVIRRKRK